MHVQHVNKITLTNEGDGAFVSASQGDSGSIIVVTSLDDRGRGLSEILLDIDAARALGLWLVKNTEIASDK